jgi:lactoylglutathione lyase
MRANTAMPLFQKVDCLRLYVSDLDAGLAFYRDALGHALIWRIDMAAGLRLSHTDTEILLQVEERRQDIDLKVEDAVAAVLRFQAAGGRVVAAPFDIQIGKAAVVEDPWGNRLVLLDTSKGLLVTDAEGNIVGHRPESTLICSDTVMFEYEVHDMRRAVAWYQAVLELPIVYQGGECHTELALPLAGARLALSLAAPEKKIDRAARLFLRTDDLEAVEAALAAKRVRTRREEVNGAVRILWVEDSEGNHFAFEEWLNR